MHATCGQGDNRNILGTLLMRDETKSGLQHELELGRYAVRHDPDYHRAIRFICASSAASSTGKLHWQAPSFFVRPRETSGTACRSCCRALARSGHSQSQLWLLRKGFAAMSPTSYFCVLAGRRMLLTKTRDLFFVAGTYRRSVTDEGSQHISLHPTKSIRASIEIGGSKLNTAQDIRTTSNFNALRECGRSRTNSPQISCLPGKGHHMSLFG
jgi:hypothetical protein